MARRRIGQGDDLEDAQDDASLGGDIGGGFDISNFRGVESPLIGGPDEQQFGIGPSPSPGLTGEERGRVDADMAAGIFDNPIAGNTDTARDLRPRSAPNTISQSPAFGLPQGVSVNESMGADESMFSQDTPALPQAPTPTAGRMAQPAFSQPESPTASGPRRVSSSPSALFGEQGGSTMFGRAGGLLGGGIGVPGSGSDGEVDPTQMFKKLLEQFGQQG